MYYTGIIVSNIYRVISFYQNILKFEIIEVFQIDGVEFDPIFKNKLEKLLLHI